MSEELIQKIWLTLLDLTSDVRHKITDPNMLNRDTLKKADELIQQLHPKNRAQLAKPQAQGEK